MGQSRSTWKRLERETAKQIGGVRNGNRGIATADAESGNLAIECKSWSRPPERVEAALVQAELAADAAGGLLPVARIHTKGGRTDNDLAVVRWHVLVNLLRDAGLIDLSGGEA